MDQSYRNRFYEKTRASVDGSGCLLWTAGFDQHGYGMFWLDGHTIHANRAVWLLERGAIPDKMEVCHKCDNDGCVNIEHLFLGTRATNRHDMAMKGRGRISKKLHQCEVEEIRRLVSLNVTLKILSKMFHVSYAHIWDIVHKRSCAGPYARHVWRG